MQIEKRTSRLAVIGRSVLLVAGGGSFTCGAYKFCNLHETTKRQIKGGLCAKVAAASQFRRLVLPRANSSSS